MPRDTCHTATKAGKRTEKGEKCMIKGKESNDAENSTNSTKLSVVLRRNKSVPPSSHDVIYNVQNIISGVLASSWWRVGSGVKYF